AAGRERPRRATYVVIMTAIALVLGLLPQRAAGIVTSEVGFTLCSFGAIVVVAGGDPGGPRRTSLGRSLLLVLVGAAGIFVTLGVAWIVLVFAGAHVE